MSAIEQVSNLCDETKRPANFAIKDFTADPDLFGERREDCEWEKYDTSMRDLDSVQKKRPLESYSLDDKKQKNICNKLNQSCIEISPEQQFNLLQNCNENIPLEKVQNRIEDSPLEKKDCNFDLDELHQNRSENDLSTLTNEELEALIPKEILKNILTEEDCRRIFKNTNLSRRNLLEYAVHDEKMRILKISQEKLKEEEKQFYDLLNRSPKDIRKLYFEELEKSNRLGEPFLSSDFITLNQIIESFNSSNKNDINHSDGATEKSQNSENTSNEWTVVNHEKSKSSKQENSNSVNQTTGKKIQNPKMLILDFIIISQDNIRLVNKILHDYTPIRKFSMKTLTKGGISILFTSETAKKLAEPILLEQLKDKLKIKGFMNNKKFFEIISYVPSYVEIEELSEAINADHFLNRYGKVVFFMKSLNAAKDLVENGFLFRDTFFNFEIFVFKPKIGCQNCGSFKHFQCEAKDTKSGSTVMYCRHCYSTEHNSFKCVIYLDFLKEAKAKKRKTYAEAISAPSSISTSSKKKIGATSSKSQFIQRKENYTIHENKSSNNFFKNMYENPLSFITTIVSSVLMILNNPANPEDISSAIMKSFESVQNQKSSDYTKLDDETIPEINSQIWPSLSKSNSVDFSNLDSSSSKKIKPAIPKKKMENLPSKYSNLKDKNAIPLDNVINHISNSAEKKNEINTDSKTRYSNAIQEKSKEMQGIETRSLYTISEEEDDDKSMELNKILKGNAKCTCGHQYVIGSGAKSHLSRKKPCSDNPKFVCSCGSFNLSLKNWTETYGKFNKHLKHECCSFSIENTGRNEF